MHRPGGPFELELELELIQTQMAQKPMLPLRQNHSTIMFSIPKRIFL
jgi:hypothetical protein